jgi:hypothetical protein
MLGGVAKCHAKRPGFGENLSETAVLEWRVVGMVEDIARSVRNGVPLLLSLPAIACPNEAVVFENTPQRTDRCIGPIVARFNDSLEYAASLKPIARCYYIFA